MNLKPEDDEAILWCILNGVCNISSFIGGMGRLNHDSIAVEFYYKSSLFAFMNLHDDSSEIRVCVFSVCPCVTLLLNDPCFFDKLVEALREAFSMTSLDGLVMNNV